MNNNKGVFYNSTNTAFPKGTSSSFYKSKQGQFKPTKENEDFRYQRSMTVGDSQGRTSQMQYSNRKKRDALAKKEMDK